MFVKCPRCSGTGLLPQFSHVEKGRCFLCKGKKQIEANIRIIAYGDNGVVNYMRYVFSKDAANRIVAKAKSYVENVAIAVSVKDIVTFTWNRA